MTPITTEVYYSRRKATFVQYGTVVASLLILSNMGSPTDFFAVIALSVCSCVLITKYKNETKKLVIRAADLVTLGEQVVLEGSLQQAFVEESMITVFFRHEDSNNSFKIAKDSIKNQDHWTILSDHFRSLIPN